MRLRHRLTLTFTAVTAVALLSSFAVATILVARDETRDLDRTLLHEARAAARHGVVEESESEAPEGHVALRGYSALYDRGGRQLLQSTRSFAGVPPALDSLGPVDVVGSEGVFVDFVAADLRLRGVLVSAASGGILLYAGSRAAIDADVRFLLEVFGALFVVSIFLTWAVAVWLGGRLSADVGAIVQVARKVATGDLAARVGSHIGASTETRELAADLDHMIAQLDELVSSQRTFVTHAAHELRSPLTTLKGELQLALRRPREAAEYRDAILATLADVDQMAELVESLLSLARAQRQGRPSDTVPAGEILDEALRMARGPADLRRVTLEVSSTAARDLAIVADRGSLARALRNLIDNAVSHSPEGRTVRLDLEEAGRLARFAVSDEGGGVSEEDAQYLFTPFYRGAQEPAGTGVGLGLAIAMEIARTHGGEVRVDRDQTSGARFLLEVPRP